VEPGNDINPHVVGLTVPVQDHHEQPSQLSTKVKSESMLMNLEPGESVYRTVSLSVVAAVAQHATCGLGSGVSRYVTDRF